MFKDIKGYEGLYKIDDKGNVYSCITNSSRRKGIMKPQSKNGYLTIGLYKDKKYKNYLIHRLVAQAFISNPNNLKEVNHIDGNKHNNRVQNLEWCTGSQNVKHSYEHGLHPRLCGEKNVAHKLTWKDVHEIRGIYKDVSCTELSKKYNVSASTIRDIKNNRIWKEGDAKCQR